MRSSCGPNCASNASSAPRMLRSRVTRTTTLVSSPRVPVPADTLPDGGTLKNTGGKRNQAMLAADAIFHF